MPREQRLRSTQGAIADAICDLKEFIGDQLIKAKAIEHLSEAAKLVAQLRHPIICAACSDRGWARYQLEPDGAWVVQICSCDIGKQLKKAKEHYAMRTARDVSPLV